MEEEQINELAEKAFPYTKGTSSFDQMRMIKGFIEGYKQAQPKWINVEERLPGFGEEYNCIQELNDGGKPVSTITEFDGIKKIFCYPGTDVEQTGITHWMPLPSPPQQ